MSRGRITGCFLGPPGRRTFVLLREPAPAAIPRGSVLVVPPFAEEMNKSRRMVTEAAQRFAEDGWATVLPDLLGTGDSEGEFRDAQVERWIDDLEQACRHAAERGLPVRAVLAVRFGCALAVAAARRGAVPPVGTSVWWQPALDGRRHLAQFLRLRVAAAGMRGDSDETVDSLCARSAAGETLAVAGYELSPALVAGLETLAVDVLPPQLGSLHWFEVVREAGAAPPLPAMRLVDRARTAGTVASITTLAVEPFWASAEIVRSTELVERTQALLTVAGTVDPDRPQASSQVSA